MPRTKQSSIEKLDEGKITIDRAIMRHWIANDPVEFKRWIDIIMMAGYKDKQFRINNLMVDCKRGEFVTSLYSLAERWKTTREVVRSFLKLLKNAHMINTGNDTRFTQITVCNYDSYQFTPHSKNTVKTQNTTRNEHETNTERHLTNKEIKEIINNNKEYIIIIKSLENIIKTKIGEPGGGAKLFNDASLMLETTSGKFEVYKKLARLITEAQVIQNTKITEEVYPNQPPLTYYRHQLGDLSKELLTSDTWHIEVCLSIKNKNNLDKDADFVKQKIPEFIALITDQGKFPVSLDDKKTHFKNWINKTLKYTANDTTKKRSATHSNLTATNLGGEGSYSEI